MGHFFVQQQNTKYWMCNMKTGNTEIAHHWKLQYLNKTIIISKECARTSGLQETQAIGYLELTIGSHVKSTVMQIEKALISDVFQTYPENFAFQLFIIFQ